MKTRQVCMFWPLSCAVIWANLPHQFPSTTPVEMTKNGRWAITWDAENRLTKIESAAGPPWESKRKLELGYDAQWRTTQKVVYTNGSGGYVAQYTNRFVYDGWNLIAILDATNGLERTFTWGLDASGTLQGAGGVGGLVAMTVHQGACAGTYFYAHDGNHNVVALVSATDGSIAAQYEYGPLGQLLRATGPLLTANPFLFSTKFYDWETAFYYYGYRYYDPVTGRWSSRDPVGEGAGVNLYGFVGNDPINYVDPLGLDPAFASGIGMFSGLTASQQVEASRTAAPATVALVAGTLTGGAADALLAGGGFMSGGSLVSAGIVGGISGVGGDVGYQGTKMGLGSQEEFDWRELGLSGVAGGVLGTAANALAPLLNSRCSPRVPISQWGRPGLEPGWVMQGPRSPLNYMLSGKYQPSWFPTFGQPPNIPAPYVSGMTHNVPPASLQFPPGPLGLLKAALGQRIYKP